jgi:regulator of sigma E protease
VLSINNKEIVAFRDIATEAAMSSASKPASILIERSGIDQPIEYLADLKPGAQMGLLDLGVTPLRSTELLLTDDLRTWKLLADNYGLDQIPPGSTINSVNGLSVTDTVEIQNIALSSTSLTIKYTTPEHESVEIAISTQQELMTDFVEINDSTLQIDHLFGLTGLMRVHPDVSIEDTKQGLMPGDIFTNIAGVEYPSLDLGIKAIRENTGRPIDIQVLRDVDGVGKLIDLEVQVSDDGRVGFYPDTTTYDLAFVTMSSSIQNPLETTLPNGAMIVSVAGRPIATLDEAVRVLFENNAESVEVVYTTQGSDEPKAATILLSLDQLQSLASLDRRWPGGADMSTLFLPVQTIDQATSPVAAVKRGIHESRRVMLQTYLTFLRLTQGTVKVEHLKGPVGIAHIGTLIADEGFIKVLFFMALISINLAVINFLPLPIVDGGQFLFLIYEWVRGKPIPIPVQNAVTMAGLLLIGSMFLLVTFNDIKSLIGF